MARPAPHIAEDERQEAPDIVGQKAQKLADQIRKSKQFIVFTGAGVSTSAGVPDIRGPNGSWTLKSQGRERTEKIVSTLQAIPTPTHMALVELQNRGFLKYLISQNSDGLHRRSGILPDKISELHGNRNREYCKDCGKEYIRDFRAATASEKLKVDHRTGRKCAACGGGLYDTIINFGESLFEEPLEKAYAAARNADLCLVLGSSLVIPPANKIPQSIGKRKNAKLVICNLQSTELDELSDLRIYSKVDDLMIRVMDKLDIPIPNFILHHRLIVELFTKDETRHHLKVYGVDVDNTLATFLRSVKLEGTRRAATSEPFEINFRRDLDPWATLKLELEFMGNYGEPNVEIVYEYHKDNDAKSVYLLDYDPMMGEWAVRKEESTSANGISRNQEIMNLTNQSSGLRLLVVGSEPLAIETFPNQKDEPEYAILSHTWSTNEVSFQDVLAGRSPERQGYQKIMACCKQASQDGFKYLWVDTCCIDKTSSAELQEAICSMYKWYKNARVCYAYLEDFEPHWSPTQLKLCRWFKRGWTLQELIAPSLVKFYNSNWDNIGTKASLCQQIAGITGIDPLVLRGANPVTRTVAERMSWASERSTSRIEDTAYSLMGLFNVFMPMLYGEGDRAFLRLQEEIMKQSEDYTIFAWKRAGSDLSERGIFARSPAEFGNVVENGGDQVITQFLTPFHELPDPAALTSRGLLIGLPLLKEYDVEDQVLGTNEIPPSSRRAFPQFSRSQYSNARPGDLKPGIYMALICRVNSRDGIKRQILCIWLRKNRERGVFTRLYPESVALLPEKQAEDFATHTIYAQPSESLVL